MMGPALRRALRAALPALFLFGCSTDELHLQSLMSGSDDSTLTLNGEWLFRSVPGAHEGSDPPDEGAGWETVSVPANWYLEGHDVHGKAWYKRRFFVPHRYRGRFLRLVFEGVDYFADVRLNGRPVGRHEGYFQPFSMDVSDAIEYGAENHLAVLVDSPLEKPEDWSLRKRLIKGIFSHHDTRPGGAWSPRGQEKNTGGIWAPVYLKISDRAAIEHGRVTPRVNLEEGRAVAAVALHVAAKGDGPRSVVLRYDLTPHNFDSPERLRGEVPVHLVPGSSDVAFDVALQSPRLWWPREHGEPNLYRLDVTIEEGGAVLDRHSLVFGFRSVAFDPARNAWIFNGRRLFIRGTNYIASQWLSEMSEAKFTRDIALMKAAHINAVRVHAHVASEAFYRLCDAHGLLVWQDFPLQWGYSDDPVFHAEAVRQAGDMVRFLYNHPSIIAWSLQNEPPWEAEWMKTKYPDYRPDQNRALTDALYRAVASLDGSRHVHPYSSTKEHPWLGWYSGSWQDFSNPTELSIVSEYGAQALPDLDSLRRIFAEDELWPRTDAAWDKWAYHNFQRYETFELAKVPMGASPAEFVRNTQVYQAKLIRYAAESYRRQRYNPVSSIYQFMFVEDWPSVNWGVVDYWRKPKAGYRALAKAYQPVLPSLEWRRDAYAPGERVEVGLWVINDLWKPFPAARVEYRLSRGGEPIAERGLTLDIAADSATRIETLTWTELPAGRYALVATIRDGNGAVLGVNDYAFTVTEPGRGRP